MPDLASAPVTTVSQSPRAIWVAALVSFVLTLSVPLLVTAAVTDEPPEVRVLQTDGRVSALIADGAVRVLVLNSTDPRTARSTLGAARPWEPSPQIVVAPADDDAATGLLAVVRAGQPQTVIVAGIPGADPIWHVLERECRERGIELRFTAGGMRIDGESLTVSVFGIGADDGAGRSVIVRDALGGATVAIALDRGVPAIRAHALVTSGDGSAANAALIVTTDAQPRRLKHAEVALGFRDRARIVLERDGIEVFGGTYRGPSARVGE